MNNIFRHINAGKKTNKSKSNLINEKKGQADTVFEVLIAVILLGFVLAAGTLAMSSLSNTKCSKSIDIALGDLRLALEKASGSTLLNTDYFFDLPYCFGSQNDIKVTLARQANASLCNSYCPGSSGQCYLIKYDNAKDKVNPIRYVCVQISPIVVLNSSENCKDDTLELVVADSTNGVPLQNGKYVFASRNLSTQGSLPNMCIYKKGQ